MEQLWKGQVSSKQLMVNIYLQYYMNMIKKHITSIISSLTTLMNPLLLASLCAVLCILWFLALPQLFCHLNVSPKNTPILCCVLILVCFVLFLVIGFFILLLCFVCFRSIFLFAGAFLSCIVFDLSGSPYLSDKASL